MYMAQLKAVNINLQQMEFRAHSGSVSEYQMDVLSHLLEQESKSLPNLRLIQQQPQINLNMRPLLLDFLLEVINKSKMSKATFPLSVNLIDRYCSTRIVKKHHFQLLGLTCLWVACKNLDSKFKVPTLEDLRRMCCKSYDKKLFLEMENHLLISLNWMINAPTYDTYIDLFLNLLLAGSKNASVNKSTSTSSKFEAFNRLLVSDVKVLSLFVCELMQFYPNIYFSFTTVQIAICAVITSLLILDIPININSYLKFFNDIVRISKQDDESESVLYVLTNIETVNVYTDSMLNEIPSPLASPKNVTMPASAFKSLMETNGFSIPVHSDSPSSNYSIDHNEVLSFTSFNQLYSNLVRILKSPPNSIRAKYFSEEGKYVRLMRAVIEFANLNKRFYTTAKHGSLATLSGTLTGGVNPPQPVGIVANVAKPRVRKISTEPATPNTPKCNGNHYGLPPTPVSSNISPKDKDPEPYLGLQQQALGRQAMTSEQRVQLTRKRTFEDAVAIANSSSTGVFNQPVALSNAASANGTGNKIQGVTLSKSGAFGEGNHECSNSYMTTSIPEAEEEEFDRSKNRVSSGSNQQDSRRRGHYSVGGDMKRCKSQPHLSNFL